MPKAPEGAVGITLSINANALAYQALPPAMPCRPEGSDGFHGWKMMEVIIFQPYEMWIFSLLNCVMACRRRLEALR